MQWFLDFLGIVIYVLAGIFCYGLFIEKDYGKWFWVILPIWPLYFIAVSVVGGVFALFVFMFPNAKIWEKFK